MLETNPGCTTTHDGQHTSLYDFVCYTVLLTRSTVLTGRQKHVRVLLGANEFILKKAFSVSIH